MLGELSLGKNPAGDTEIKLRKEKNEKDDNLEEAEKSLALLSWHGH